MDREQITDDARVRLFRDKLHAAFGLSSDDFVNEVCMDAVKKLQLNGFGVVADRIAGELRQCIHDGIKRVHRWIDQQEP